MGEFICFEGIDGVGKTTISELVFKKAISSGVDVVYVNKKATKDLPDYARKHLDKIKEVLWLYDKSAPLEQLGDTHWLFLNLSWFSAIYYAKVKDLVKKHDFVIVDNWYYKLFSRFCIKPTFNIIKLEEIFSIIPEPDRVVFLDVNPEDIKDRRSEFSKTETGKMDGYNDFVEYQTKVKEKMKEIANSKNWICINETDLKKSTDQITEELGLVV